VTVGVLNAVSKFQHKAEIRESKDEIMVGEIVRAMSRMGHTADSFVATGDFQRMRFRARDDVLTYIYIQLDRKTGGGRLSSAVVGSRGTLTVGGEVKNLLSDPDDVVAMWRTDFKNIAKLGLRGQVKVNHEHNSIIGRTTDMVNIDDFALKGDAGLQALIAHLGERVGRVRSELAPYKKHLK
jgi:hypothetical protein